MRGGSSSGLPEMDIVEGTQLLVIRSRERSWEVGGGENPRGE